MYEEEIHFGKLLLKISETVLTHLTPVTLTFDPIFFLINRVPLLPRTDVWTKFEECTLSRSSVIGRNQKGYRRTDRC